MKNILLASGDSWTDDNHESLPYPKFDCSWPKWPKLLANKMELKCVNKGSSGQGNEYIFSSIIDSIVSIGPENIHTIAVLWTEFSRVDYEYHPSSTEHAWGAHRLNPDGDMNGWINKTLRLYYSLQVICDRFNIKCIQSHGLSVHLTSMDMDKTLMKHLSKNLYYEFIDNNINFLGWPMMSSMNGFNLEKKLITPHGNAARVGPLDWHPNAFGHKLIAEYFYENL